MSSNALSNEGEILFRSEWLRSLVSPEQFTLPPPLPSPVGAIHLDESVPSSIDRGEGLQLSRYYYQRIESIVRKITETGKLSVQIGNYINHYVRYCRSRLTRVFDVLEPKQRIYFALVPYLLNANAPGLPGYQPSMSGPHGVFDHDGHATIMRAVEQIFGHRQQHSSRQGSAIDSIFFESPLGSMSQVQTPQFTFWLIMKEGILDGNHGNQLRGKINDIQDWLNSKGGLQVQFYMIDYENFEHSRQNQPPHSVLGSMSKSIFRERIYRESIYLMGKMPLWWLTHPESKAEHYNKLVSAFNQQDQGRMGGLSFLSLIDLGFLDSKIDKSELINYTFEQLTQSLFNPFEGVMQMAFNYARLNQVPFDYLCKWFKKSIFRGDYELEYTDMRFLLLTILNYHFSKGTDRYDQRLFRVCVYLSIGIPASRSRGTSREYEIMRAYARQWGWDDQLVEELDQFLSWPIEKTNLLAQVLRRFLLKLYNKLSLTVQSQDLEIDSERDIIRRRRLSACFESMIGKVPHLFTYFLPTIVKEDHLVFIENVQAPPAIRWELYREENRSSGYHPPLFAGESLSQIAAWSVFNGLFHPHSVISLMSPHSEYNIIETRALLHRFHGLINFQAPPYLDDQTYTRAPKIKRLIITASPTSFKEEDTNSYAAQGWDILNYGQQRRSQLTDISVITQNSWGELFCRRYQGEEAFTQAMKSLFADAGTRIDLDQPPEIIGPNDRVQPIVRKRIVEILNQAQEVFAEGDDTSKIFTYEVGGQFQVIYKGPDGARMNTVRSLRGVIRRCGRMSEFDQSLLIDQLSPSLREIRSLVSNFQKDDDAKIYVGWRQKERLGYVVVCDEKERLFFQQSSARETRLVVMRVVRRLLPYLRKKVSNARELKRALRVFEFQEGQIIGGRGPVFTEATTQVLGALAKAKTGKKGLFLVGDFEQGRGGIGLQYGSEQFMASRYGSSFVYACIKHIVDQEGFDDPDSWTLDGSKVQFGSDYMDQGPGVVQHLRLISIYQKEITKALNYILQHHLAAAQ